MVESGETVTRTVRQRIYDVAGFKIMRTKLGRRLLRRRSHSCGTKKKMKYAKSTEKVTAGFVDAAMTIYTRILSQPVAVSALEWCDANLPGPKNPFSSVWCCRL